MAWPLMLANDADKATALQEASGCCWASGQTHVRSKETHLRTCGLLKRRVTGVERSELPENTKLFDHSYKVKFFMPTLALAVYEVTHWSQSTRPFVMMPRTLVGEPVTVSRVSSGVHHVLHVRKQRTRGMQVGMLIHASVAISKCPHAAKQCDAARHPQRGGMRVSSDPAHSMYSVC
jgi:hypothetical protein